MAGKTRKKQIRGEYTRISLLEAATELFAAHGFEGASVKQITERAGASVGSFYHHFNDKADLFTQVLDNGSMTLRRYFRKVRNLPPDVSLEERTHQAISALVDFATEHRSLWVWLLLETDKLPQPIRKIVKKDQELYLRDQAQDLEAAVRLGRLKPLDAKLGAQAVFGMCVHMLSVYLNDPNPDRDAYVDAITKATVGILRAMAGSRQPAYTAPGEKALKAG
ncbi:transcriptional regulator, TetR family [Desulfatibacillum alkenivorans DSM 16219]|jgi:AcrR family transcriptional regulator|uniref:Transcriptional regulator, TetR family n=1 Tax=Desulfatibacillum alkenivorans DSM 16219 TaxID=1121393 RepID=A0A1M6NM10_9BACT|nr:TetR/AcrR family transcriptional regulator [Desulfatibacillum alkenivorans]SHJ96654.1 transcriptional regulator, TetR family [Desulfatibacillum alkenivorans DSM 16219]